MLVYDFFVDVKFAGKHKQQQPKYMHRTVDGDKEPEKKKTSKWHIKHCILFWEFCLDYLLTDSRFDILWVLFGIGHLKVHNLSQWKCQIIKTFRFCLVFFFFFYFSVINENDDSTRRFVRHKLCNETFFHVKRKICASRKWTDIDDKWIVPGGIIMSNEACLKFIAS